MLGAAPPVQVAGGIRVVVDELLRNVLGFLAGGGSPLAYALLGAAAAVEYVFPPFPGDTVILFGAFLAATADFDPVGVWATMTLGSIAGGMATYALGRRFDDVSRWPRWMQGPRARAGFADVRRRFDSYGPIVLLVNRFVPALRAFFFIAAGMARMPAGRVVLYGGLSAAVWNALLLVAGYLVGHNWERLVELSQRYTVGALVVIALVVTGAVWRWRRARRRRTG